MENKFAVKEAWLLDENGNKLMQLTPLDPNDVFKDHVNLENVRGGVGKNNLFDNKSK